MVDNRLTTSLSATRLQATYSQSTGPTTTDISICIHGTHRPTTVQNVDNQSNTTRMVHYVCHVCQMNATCVANPAAVLAWMDHMERHALRDDYSAYGWDVQRLPFVDDV